MNNPIPNKEVPQNSTQEEINKKRKTHEKIYVRDESTGIVYELHPEKTLDTSFAIISILYLLFMLAFFFWQLFDVWIGQYSLVHWIGYDIGRLGSPSFRLVTFTFIGGGLGGIINGIRSIIGWHSERSAFGRRFVWKYIVAPWTGTALALFAFALIRSGVAIIGGDFKTDAADIRQTLSMFAIGVLSGYGSREVFIWLDAQVKRIFKVTVELKVPDLLYKTKSEAEKILKAANLKLGEVSEETTEDQNLVDKVIKQEPASEKPIAEGGLVNITIAVKKTE